MVGFEVTLINVLMMLAYVIPGYLISNKRRPSSYAFCCISLYLFAVLNV